MTLFLIFITSVLNAQALTPGEANELTMQDCIHEDSIDFDWEDSNTGILTTICELGFILGRQTVITSNHRESSSGQHKHANAWDFYYSYEGIVGKCEVVKQYKEDVNSMIDWLDAVGWDEVTGFGVYPFMIVMHLDFRGRKSRWAFDSEKREINFQEGLDQLDRLIDRECG